MDIVVVVVVAAVVVAVVVAGILVVAAIAYAAVDLVAVAWTWMLRALECAEQAWNCHPSVQRNLGKVCISPAKLVGVHLHVSTSS